MNLQLTSIVAGRDVAGPGSITSVEPATGLEIATVPALDAAGAEAAIAAARDAFPAWANTPVAERQRLLARWLDLMIAERGELARLMSREGGKPVAEALLVDITPAAGTLGYWARHAAEHLAFRPQPPEMLVFAHWPAGYRFDPLGVLSVITPWNYPVGIPLWELAPALVAGNTVVFKPASDTVLTGLYLADQARRAGFPPGVLNGVALPGSASNVLLDHPHVAKVLFTGSVDVGRHVARRCAERLIPAQLELGGKDAAVVAADAALERTARGVVWAAFMNTGQSCASLERLYVERPLYERLLARIVELTRELKVGDPLGEDTDLGPMTNQDQLDTVARQVEQALARGARALTGGAPLPGPGFFYPPTVLVDVDDGMEVMREETFGPVLPVIPVADLDEGIRRANASRFGLTASGWTTSSATAERFRRELHAGVVAVNEHGLAAAGEPTGSWGGVGESGIGRAHGPFGLHEVVNVKYVFTEDPSAAASPWYYPYDADFRTFIDAAIPTLFGHGLERYGTMGQLAATRRFRERMRKGTLLRNIRKVL